MPASTEANRPGPKPRADHGPKQSRDLLGLKEWQWDRARAAGLIPEPDRPRGRWSNHVIEDAQARLPQILAVVGTHPGHGPHRAAKLLAQHTDHHIDYDVITDLAATGVLTPVGHYEGKPLYAEAAILALADRPELAEASARRRQYLDATVDGYTIRARLDWSDQEWQQVAATRGLNADLYRRHPAELVDELLADTDLRIRVRRARTLNPDQAAAALNIRPVDLEYLVAAGLLTPIHRKGQPGGVDKGDVSGGQFLVGDLEDVRDDEELPWEALHAVTGRQTSPLREIMPTLPSRADLIRAAATALTADLGTTFEAVWVEPRRRRNSDPYGEWHLRWETDPAGHPTAAAVRRMLDAGPAARYRREIVIAPAEPSPDQPDSTLEQR